jgi:hypothetical protein
MSDEVVKAPMRELDGFDTYEDAVEGEDDQQLASQVIKGTMLKFTNEAKWVTREGVEISPELELVPVNVGRVVQKWIDQVPVETITLDPGQKFPDIEQLNAETPKSEWAEGPDGKPRGPWQAQHIVYLLNPATMDRYCFPTGTVGGHICVRDLVDRIQWMRKFRGANVYPIVTLSSTFMKTRFGGRQRPHFEIKQRWIGFPGSKTLAPASPAPLAPPNTATETVPPEKEPTGAHTVEPPSLGEEMGDSIPF